MTNLRRSDIFYPIYPDINDQPEPPTSLKGGNGADFIQRFNNLISAIAPRIILDFSNAEADLGTTVSEFELLMLPVPFSVYQSDPAGIEWSYLLGGLDPAGIISYDQSTGFLNVFTVGLTVGGAYGGGSPLDSSYWEATECTGKAALIDLPQVSSRGTTWNHLIGVLPLEPNLKIKLRPTHTKPAMNQLINARSFSLS